MGIEEDRFQLALETVTETISEYGEDVIIEAFRLILKEYDYEVVKLDPGPDDDVESGEVWPREDDIDLMARAFPGKLVPFPRRWT